MDSGISTFNTVSDQVSKNLNVYVVQTLFVHLNGLEKSHAFFFIFFVVECMCGGVCEW